MTMIATFSLAVSVTVQVDAYVVVEAVDVVDDYGNDDDIYIYGLLRSSFIMGVHPGCPVCAIVAASLVTVEIDVGETISAAKVA